MVCHRRARRSCRCRPSRLCQVAGTRAYTDRCAYHLDAGDRLRVVVYGQEGLTNTYAISAGGTDHHAADRLGAGARPHAGRASPPTSARACATDSSASLRSRSRSKSYRPFFILGEVQAPGQYPYVPNMTVESAVAIAGGFSPRARNATASRITHTDARRHLARRGAAGHANQPRRYRAGRRALVLPRRLRRHFFICLAKNSRLRGQAISALALS